MKKYQQCTKEELLNIIKEKNNTISKLNGQVYYYKKFKEYYKKTQQRYYDKLKELEEANNGK